MLDTWPSRRDRAPAALSGDSGLEGGLCPRVEMVAAPDVTPRERRAARLPPLVNGVFVARRDRAKPPKC
jgi:hypothetical protein